MNRASLLVFGLLGVLMMLAAACGGEEAAPTFARATVAPAAITAPTELPAEATTPPRDGAISHMSHSHRHTFLEISVDGDELAFDKSGLKMGDRTEIVLVFDNVSTINQHNWVLVKPGTKDDVAARGAAHPSTNWIQPDDPDVFANTRLLNAGETVEVNFDSPATGSYQFVCTFPGHNLTMFGDFIVTP